MNPVLEKNIKILCQNDKLGEKKKQFIQNIEIGSHLSLDETGIVYFENLGKRYQLVSRNSEEEVKYLSAGIDFKKDNLLIVFGLGNLLFLEYLLLHSSKHTQIAVFEPNKYVLKYIFSQYDIQHILKDERITLFVEDELTQELEQEITKSSEGIWEVLVQNINIVSLPNYYVYQKFQVDIVKHIRMVIDNYILAAGNSLEDEFKGFYNNYRNIDAFIECNGIQEVIGKFKGYPAIIVASGPSLDKNINILKRAQDKALIITCDASYDACIKNGVKPDAIASIERVQATYQYYYKNKEFDKELVLFGPGLLFPSIFKEFQGKKVLMSKLEKGVEKWWRDHFERVEYVPMGLSCANVAFAVTAYAGCNPIILIGQDLAFTDDKIHSDLTHTKFEGNNDSKLADGTIVEDVYGNQVRTNQIYNLFRFWIEKQIRFNPSLCVVDATEGGAKIAGTEIMSLSEAIDKFCKKTLSYHMNDCLEKRNITKTEYLNKYQEIIRDGKKQLEILKDIQKKAEKYYEKLIEYYEIDLLNEKQSKEMLKRLEEGKKLINYIEKQDTVISFYKQIIMQEAIYEKKEGNAIEPDIIKRKIQLHANLFGMIKRSTVLIIEKYQEMIEFITLKGKERNGEGQ